MTRVTIRDHRIGATITGAMTLTEGDTVPVPTGTSPITSDAETIAASRAERLAIIVPIIGIVLTMRNEIASLIMRKAGK